MFKPVAFNYLLNSETEEYAVYLSFYLQNIWTTALITYTCCPVRPLLRPLKLTFPSMTFPVSTMINVLALIKCDLIDTSVTILSFSEDLPLYNPMCLSGYTLGISVALPNSLILL